MVTIRYSSIVDPHHIVTQNDIEHLFTKEQNVATHISQKEIGVLRDFQ